MLRSRVAAQGTEITRKNGLKAQKKSDPKLVRAVYRACDSAPDRRGTDPDFLQKVRNFLILVSKKSRLYLLGDMSSNYGLLDRV